MNAGLRWEVKCFLYSDLAHCLYGVAEDRCSLVLLRDHKRSPVRVANVLSMNSYISYQYLSSTVIGKSTSDQLLRYLSMLEVTTPGVTL